MDMATFLKGTSNVLMVISLVKLLGAYLGSEIRHDSASLRQKANRLIQKSPYSAAGFAAAAGAVTGLLLSQRRSPRTIPTRF
jgi:hypothetical protein